MTTITPEAAARSAAIGVAARRHGSRPRPSCAADRVRRRARRRRGRRHRLRRRRRGDHGTPNAAPARHARGVRRPPPRPHRRRPPPRCPRCASRARGRCRRFPARSAPAPIADVVHAYQQRLADLHFDPGPVDGNYGPARSTRCRPCRRCYGLPRHRPTRQPGGARLAAFQYPAPLQPNGEVNRTEIDVDQAGAHALRAQSAAAHHDHVHGIGRALLLQLAAGEPDAPHLRGRDHAVRPLRLHTMGQGLGQVPARPAVPAVLLQRRHRGARVHEVPTTPASHGCARIPMHIAEYFPLLVQVGDPVYVFGGQPAQILSS